MNLIYRFGWTLVRFIARVIFRAKTIHSDLMPPAGSVIIASNHASYFDPPMVGGCVKREIHFLAKKELFRNKIFGYLISAFNAHPVRRQGFDRKAIAMTMQILHDGNAIVVFPEGTRSDGKDFLPARPGIGLLARRGGFPVLPLYLHNTHRLMDCFLGRRKCRAIFGEIMPSAEIEKYPDNREGYKSLADDIMDRIKRLKEEYVTKSDED